MPCVLRTCLLTQCGKLEPLAAFDDNKRSCRVQLARRRAGKRTPSSTAVPDTRNDNAAAHAAAGSQGVVASPTGAALAGSPPSTAVNVPPFTQSFSTMQPASQLLQMQPPAEVPQVQGEVGAVSIEQQIMLLEQSRQLLQCQLAYLQTWNNLQQQQAGSGAFNQQQPQQPCPAPAPAAVPAFAAAGGAPAAAVSGPWASSTCQSFSAGGPAAAQPQQAAAMAGSQAIMTSSTGGWTAPVSTAYGAAGSPSAAEEHSNPFDIAMRTMEFGSAPAKTASGLCGSPEASPQFAADMQRYQRSSSASPIASSKQAPVAAPAAAGAFGPGTCTSAQQHGQPAAGAQAAGGPVLSAAAQDSLLDMLRMDTDALGALTEEDDKLADQMVGAIMAQSCGIPAADMVTSKGFPSSQQHPEHIQCMFGASNTSTLLQLSLRGGVPSVQLLQHTPAPTVQIPAGFQPPTSSPFAAVQTGAFIAPPTALPAVSAALDTTSGAGCSSTVRLQGAAQAQTEQLGDSMRVDSLSTFTGMCEVPSWANSKHHKLWQPSTSVQPVYGCDAAAAAYKHACWTARFQKHSHVHCIRPGD